MRVVLHFKSGKVIEKTDVEITEDMTRLVVHEVESYSVIPLISLDWYDVEF